MAEIEKIKNIAHQTLAITNVSGEKDNYLWDRAQRLVKNAEKICQLNPVQQNYPIDRFCLITATYFCESGYTKFANSHSFSSKMLTPDISTSEITDFSTQTATEKLSETLPNSKIEKITKIISQTGNRFTEMPEAMILADAKSLDDIGAVGIFNEFRRYIFQGKGVSNILQSWKRKIDYQYWDARLKESFRFQCVRDLAARRFETVCAFMDQLENENSARDIEELILETL